MRRHTRRSGCRSDSRHSDFAVVNRRKNHETIAFKLWPSGSRSARAGRASAAPLVYRPMNEATRRASNAPLERPGLSRHHERFSRKRLWPASHRHTLDSLTHPLWLPLPPPLPSTPPGRLRPARSPPTLTNIHTHALTQIPCVRDKACKPRRRSPPRRLRAARHTRHPSPTLPVGRPHHSSAARLTSWSMVSEARFALRKYFRSK